MKNIDIILNKLFSLKSNKKRENIDDLKKLYNSLNKPCKNSKIIHIAGTNGKGSTATFIENILLASGHTVGKFTSPHILKYNERIIFNKEMIDDESIIKHYNYLVKNYNLSINFFEMTFFIALLFFKHKNPDFIILETGLGGRLDATNVVNSDIVIITNISFDHVNILGTTLDFIAYEKTGIIKNNEICIYSQNSDILTKHINNKTTNSINVLDKYKNICINLDKNNFKTIVTINNNEFVLPLFGEFQAHNFLNAYEVAKMYNISNDSIQIGLNNCEWPARFEIFKNDPTIILDVAHNEDSMQKLIDNLKLLYKKNEIIIITSFLATKDITSIFSEIYSITNEIIVTSLKDVTFGLTSNEIKERLSNDNVNIENIIFEDDIKNAYNYAISKIQNDNLFKAIVICGSFYEISKFRESFSS